MRRKLRRTFFRSEAKKRLTERHLGTGHYLEGVPDWIRTVRGMEKNYTNLTGV